jgi:hypothetical protein
MNTTPNNNDNAAGAQGTGNNPRKCFAVSVGRNDYLQWDAYIVAATAEEAEQAGLRIAETRPDEAWKVTDRDYLVLEVRQVQGGQSHE